MANSSILRPILANAVLVNLPPLIRHTLIKESSFCEEYGFVAKTVIPIGDSGISIQRSILFDAIREVLSGASDVELADTDGRNWRLNSKREEGKLPAIVISCDEQRIRLVDFTVLSPNSADRMHLFDQTVSYDNFPTTAHEAWYDIFLQRALKDNEVEEFYNDYDNIPVNLSRFIQNRIKNRQIKTSSLVPTSRKYFERLVGVYDGSTSIQDYAVDRGKQLFKDLSLWKPYEGFLYSLFLSSHSALTEEINAENLNGEDVLRAFEFLEKHGDRISQLGAIEVGLRILSEKPEIEPIIIRLIEQIRDDDVDEQGSGFKLISALFVLVDGELSRLRMFQKEPPFYRRLASLSHATLIIRQFLNSGIDIDSFFKWAFKNRGEQYYMQSLADMRIEPLWDPELVAPPRMKANFLGRIMSATIKYEQHITSSRLRSLVLGNESNSLLSFCESPSWQYLPGPLEGGEDSLRILPAHLSEVTEKQLNSEAVGPSSFIGLINFAPFFRTKTEQVESAVKILRRAKYRLADVEDRPQLVAILNGLAKVAAASRSGMLADELRILVRNYRRYDSYAPSVGEIIDICLTAAASRTNLNDWREFVGDWLTELAFSDLKKDDGYLLNSRLQCLCRVVPELWVSYGKADAALKAFIAH